MIPFLELQVLIEVASEGESFIGEVFGIQSLAVHVPSEGGDHVLSHEEVLLVFLDLAQLLVGEVIEEVYFAVILLWPAAWQGFQRETACSVGLLC
jgi:hypothetical protein